MSITWDDMRRKTDEITIEMANTCIGVINEQRKVFNLPPLPNYPVFKNRCCCEDSKDTENSSKELDKQIDLLKDQLINNYEERLKKLHETPFNLGDRIDDICSKCKDDIETTKTSPNTIVNITRVGTLILNPTILGEDDSDEC